MRTTLSQMVGSLALVFLPTTLALAGEGRTLHTPVPAITSQLQRLERVPATNSLQLAIGLPLRDWNALCKCMQVSPIRALCQQIKRCCPQFSLLSPSCCTNLLYRPHSIPSFRSRDSGPLLVRRSVQSPIRF